jgi:transcriptional regulator with XRE-family HTH domain
LVEEREAWEQKVGQAFGGALAALRTKRGLSQELLAEAAGYHRTYVSLLERGKHRPSLTTVIRLAVALGVSPSELVRQVERELGLR